MKKEKYIQVCDHCLTASCWYGEHQCWESLEAGTVLKPISELKKLNVESSLNWSDEKLKAIYGEIPHYTYTGENKNPPNTNN